MDIQQNNKEISGAAGKPQDRFLYPLFIFTGLIFVIHFLTFWIYMGLGNKQSGVPTKTNCFNSMWWSFLTMASALYLMHDIWVRCNQATEPDRAIPLCGWLIRLFLSFFFFKGSFIAFVSHSSILIQDAGAWSFFAFFCNAMIFTVFVLRRGTDNPMSLHEDPPVNGKSIAIWGCQGIVVIFLGIMYGFACFQAVNVSLDYTVEIVQPGKLYDGIHIYCQGSQTDSKGTIVVIPDEDTPSLTWLDLINTVSTEHRICVYDRPGYGWSESGELPRNPNRMATELYELLVQAKESLPYFLMPHGQGGHIAWSFSRKYFKTLGGMLLVNAASPGWVSQSCPKPSRPLNYDFQRTFDNFALTRLNSDQSLPNVWTQQNDTFIHKVISQRASSRMSNAVYFERIAQDSCSQNYQNYKYGFGDLPVSVFTSGFVLNTTCINELTKDSKQCDNYMDASTRNAPFYALEAYRQVKMSTNSRWYMCSDCSYDLHLDSPYELKIAIGDLIDQLTSIENIQQKSVPDLFQPRQSAMNEPKLTNNQLVTLVCRTERKEGGFSCFDSLCDWCQDQQACILTGRRECMSLNMKIFPKEDCSNFCRDQNTCTQNDCINRFIPISVGTCPSGFTCLK